MKLPDRLSRNTLILLLSSGGGALLSFALSVMIGRALGEAGLGIYAAALAWIFPLWMLAEFGLETLLVREIAQTPAAAPEYLRAAALARLMLGGGLMLVLMLAAPVLTDDPLLVRGLYLSAPLIVIGPFVSAFSAVFRARQVMWPVAALNLGMLVAQVLLTAGVLLNGGGVLLALAVNTLTSAGQLVAAWVIYRAGFYVPGAGDGRVVLRTLLRRAWPFALAGVLAVAHLRLNVILLEQMAGAGAAGQYAAANRFVEAGRMLPQALFVALFPALAALNQDEAALHRLLRRTMRGLLLYGVLCGAGLMLLGPLLVRVIYGAAFEAAGGVLQMLGWALLPGILKGARILYWYAQGQEQVVNRVLALGLALQAVLGLLLIEQAGAVGAALALVLAEGAALLLLWRKGPRPDAGAFRQDDTLLPRDPIR